MAELKAVLSLDSSRFDAGLRDSERRATTFGNTVGTRMEQGIGSGMSKGIAKFAGHFAGADRFSFMAISGITQAIDEADGSWKRFGQTISNTALYAGAAIGFSIVIDKAKELTSEIQALQREAGQPVKGFWGNWGKEGFGSMTGPGSFVRAAANLMGMNVGMEIKPEPALEPLEPTPEQLRKSRIADAGRIIQEARPKTPEEQAAEEFAALPRESAAERRNREARAKELRGKESAARTEAAEATRLAGTFQGARQPLAVPFVARAEKRTKEAEQFGKQAAALESAPPPPPVNRERLLERVKQLKADREYAKEAEQLTQTLTRLGEAEKEAGFKSRLAGENRSQQIATLRASAQGARDLAKHEHELAVEVGKTTTAEAQAASKRHEIAAAEARIRGKQLEDEADKLATMPQPKPERPTDQLREIGGIIGEAGGRLGARFMDKVRAIGDMGANVNARRLGERPTGPLYRALGEPQHQIGGRRGYRAMGESPLTAARRTAGTGTAQYDAMTAANTRRANDLLQQLVTLQKYVQPRPVVN